MKTIKITLYEFDELSDDAKAKVLETVRDALVEGSHWYQFIYEEWKEKLNAMGFDNPEIRFSGFWSQGDGASFTCKRVDISKFIASQKAKGRFTNILKAAKADKIEANFEVLRIDRHYSHEYTVQVNTEVLYTDGYETRSNVIAIEKEEFELKDLILDVVRTLSRKIYKDLESEHEGLTSDEAVIDTIKAKEYTFRANGEMENS